jgi:uncharacterized damage-inducible protein DinB
MDISSLLKKQIEETGYQLTKVLEDLTPEQWDAKLGASMSPRETMTHLADCYKAVMAKVEGGEPAWGTTELPSDFDVARAEMMQMRGLATQAVLGLDAEQAAEMATDCMVLHDAYHVGQLAALRLHLGGWDAYAIYRM